MIHHRKSFQDFIDFQQFKFLDATSKIEMKKAINTIVQAITNTQVDKEKIAYVHCHADQISLGNSN